MTLPVLSLNSTRVDNKEGLVHAATAYLKHLAALTWSLFMTTYTSTPNTNSNTSSLMNLASLMLGATTPLPPDPSPDQAYNEGLIARAFAMNSILFLNLDLGIEIWMVSITMER
jgi:hypothetical protein